MIDRLGVIDRVIGTYGTTNSGPVFFVIGGMHGNEASGVEAAHIVLNQLRSNAVHLRGELHCLAGNVQALQTNVRFVDTDLNRMWADDFVDNQIEAAENKERQEIVEYVHSVVDANFSHVWALDLHTTSGDTSPFVTIDDALPNRAFAQCAGAPIILGIEEHVHGSILEYFNERGATVMGFEGGQHVSQESVRNHVQVIYSALCYANFTSYRELHEAGIDCVEPVFPAKGQYFEIIHRHAIDPNQESFVMNEGFQSFQPVRKGQLVASNAGQNVEIERTGFLLMPLYQKLGSEGYFLIGRVSVFWLWLSKHIRKRKLHRLLRVLPGVRRGENDRELLVNTGVAFLFPVALMHLFGYRRRTNSSDHVLRFTKRRDL